MAKLLRSLLVCVLVGAGALTSAGLARADVNNATGTNVQDGNNNANTRQGGTGKSGDAVGGQVAGVVSSGRTSVDARNTSRDSSVESGDVDGSNTSRSVTGLNSSLINNIGGEPIALDVTESSCAADLVGCNFQDGSNRTTLTQTASYSTGDGVAGQVIGAVTAAGGSTSIVAANASDNVSVQSGDVDGSNDVSAFTGLDSAAILLVIPSDVSDIGCTSLIGCNFQDGSNRTNARQSATASTGDGVAGQVIGAVSAGATSIDANNTSRDVDVTTGDADVDNGGAFVTGLDAAEVDEVGASGPILIGDVTDASCFATIGCNFQDGHNRTTATQSASATSGDGVAGEVIGAVTSAGGATSIVAANSSADSDVTTGDAAAANDASAFTGLEASLITIVDAADVAGIDCSFGQGLGFACQFQDGNNSTTLGQSARAATGDGVAGQVIGSVSAGRTSIDARNASSNVSAETGDAGADNAASVFTGHQTSLIGLVGEPLILTDVTDASCLGLVGCNAQDGSNRTTTTQSASATTGDGVAGEVIGAVTSAGGSASIVAANTSSESDVTTGDADAANDVAAYTGLLSTLILDVTAADVAAIDCEALVGCNFQDGSNRTTSRQSASASTGDGVAGQVIGAVSAGATSIDARNTSSNVSVETGDADADNGAAFFTGLQAAEFTVVGGGLAALGDVTDSSCAPLATVFLGCNLQDGNNRTTYSQSASASSGDGVAGQVIGAVTSAGGSASVVAANSSTNSDATTGDADAANTAAAFTGLLGTAIDVVEAADVSGLSCPATGLTLGCNAQDGNNSTTGNQTARASTGDGVAGQVIGVVSAGATSVDASNRTDDSSAETGDADAANSAATFVGLESAVFSTVTAAADVTFSSGTNVQDGSNRRTQNQSADATSGDAVAGQVTGVVTSAGGSASVVVANTSSGIDSLTGDSDFVNTDTAFVGLRALTGLLAIG